MVAQLPHDFATTLAAARRGDGDAWRTLYLEHSSPVLGYLRAQRAPSPEDLLGEVWLQAVRDLTRFSGDAAGFRSDLTSAGVTLLADDGHGEWRVAVPDGWANLSFFRLAGANDVVVRSLLPDDETLEELFLRTVGA